MTTSRSPLRALKEQADQIAAKLKRMADGHNDAADPLGRIDAARSRDSITFGVLMDDKVLKIEIRWKTIREASEAGLAEFILKEMRQSREGLH